MHPDIAGSYNNLGYACANLGEYRSAFGYYDKALALQLKFYPDGVHPETVTTYRNLSWTWRKAGDVTRSEEYAKKADEIEAKLKR